MVQPPSPISSPMTPKELLREATMLNDYLAKLENKINKMNKMNKTKLKRSRRRLMMVHPCISEENNDTSIVVSPVKPSVFDMNDYDTSNSFTLPISTVDSSKSCIQNDTSSTTTATHTSSNEWSNVPNPTNSIVGSLRSSTEDALTPTATKYETLQLRERLLLEEDKWLDVENKEREKELYINEDISDKLDELITTEILTETAKQLRQTIIQLEQERTALEDSISRDTQLLEAATDLTDIINSKIAQVESTLHPSKQDIENAQNEEMLRLEQEHNNLYKEIREFKTEHFPCQANYSNNMDTPPSYDLFNLIEIIMSNKEGTVIDLRKHNYWPPHVQLLVRAGMLVQHPRDAFKVQLARWSDKTLL